MHRDNSLTLVVAAPSSCTRNSVFIRREPSFSSSVRLDSRESISSMKMTAGRLVRATANKARTSFSPCPTHFELEKKNNSEVEVSQPICSKLGKSGHLTSRRTPKCKKKWHHTVKRCTCQSRFSLYREVQKEAALSRQPAGQ